MKQKFSKFLEESNIKVTPEGYVWYGLSLSDKFVEDRFYGVQLKNINTCSVYGRED